MTTTKRLGIWMDHANAHIMEFTSDPIQTTSLESPFTHEIKEESFAKGEHLMHNKEQHEQGEYYKKLAGLIRNYDEVLLFGPTDAKLELANILKEDHHFDKIKIETQGADKLTEPQQHAFVTEHFLKSKQ